ncbi:MAG: DMT family transporter [Qingshengfaniella sp.]
MDHVTSPPSQPLQAAKWMVGAILSFTTMAIAGRAVTPYLDTFEIMTFRSLFGLLLVLVIAGYRGRLQEIRTNRLGTHILRNVFHFSGQNLWFYSMTLIPLAQLMALEFSYPIWVALVAPLFLAERLTRTRLAAALIGFVGILVIVRPGMAAMNVGTLTAILSSVGFAGSAIVTKKLIRDQSITCILFWLALLQLIFGLVTSALDGVITLPEGRQWAWIVLIAVAGICAHFSVTKALSLAPASIAIPMDFARLPVIAIVAAIIYGEPLDPFVFLGGLLILGAIFTLIREKPAPEIP